MTRFNCCGWEKQRFFEKKRAKNFWTLGTGVFTSTAESHKSFFASFLFTKKKVFLRSNYQLFGEFRWIPECKHAARRLNKVHANRGEQYGQRPHRMD